MKLASTVLVFCAGALLTLGMVMLYSASMAQKGNHYLMMQLVAGGLGLAVCVITATMDYRHLKHISVVLLLVAIVLLVLVLIPGLAKETNGARRWLDLKVMKFQPSEMAKLALIIALAHYCDYFLRFLTRFKQGFLVPVFLILLVLGLVFKGKDYGTTLLLASVSGMMLLVAGMRWRYILPSTLIGLAALSLAIWTNPVRRERVKAWLDPETHKSGVGYQADQAMIALGSGGWTGLGLGNGRQKLGFVPENHTDFILSIIGEELGLVATLAIVAAFVLLVLCGLIIARAARDTFGMLLAAGLTFLIGLQAFINIGVVTSVLPNKGLPLPFISYGGSNLLMMLASLGLLLSVARQAASQPIESVTPGEPSDPGALAVS